MKKLVPLLFLLTTHNFIFAQAIDCSYPIIFIHGYTGSDDSFSDVYENGNFSTIWGELDDVFHVVLNANDQSNIWGTDGLESTNDDDVLIEFDNETNDLAAGCIYAINFNNFWNEDQDHPEIELYGCDSPGFTESDSNESAILKGGYALGKMIQKVLDANPDKEKVILVGHSMGGLTAREYLQRTNGRWWVPGGHKVAKLVTTATPHRGSNFFGNPWPLTNDDGAQARDGLPDPASEATRDLRFSYATGCGFLGLESCPGAYLFGGEEDDIWGYWNEDVDCDGDETSSITGINIAGSPDEWDGTYDNPAMPLPADIRYTWITSDILLDSGDGVVAWERQWLFDGNIPEPSDGTAHRLTDTLLTDRGHLSVNSDVDVVVRGLDEGDYPLFAWKVQLDNLMGGLVQVRDTDAPEGAHTTDPDWFALEIPAGSSGDLTISFNPHPGLAGRIDFFSNTPPDYTEMDTPGEVSQTFIAGNPTVNLTIDETGYTPGSIHYFRVIHENIAWEDWHLHYNFEATINAPLPVELINFSGQIETENVLLEWSTSAEFNSDIFELHRSFDGMNYVFLGVVDAAGFSNVQTDYTFLDRHPSAGNNYYRLKSIDRDGKTSFSNIVILNFYKDAFEIQKVFPNPAKNQLRLDFYTYSEQEIKIIFRNMLGQEVLIENYQVNQGQNHLNLNLSGLLDGIYLMEIQQGYHRQVIKIVKE